MFTQKYPADWLSRDNFNNLPLEQGAEQLPRTATRCFFLNWFFMAIANDFLHRATTIGIVSKHKQQYAYAMRDTKARNKLFEHLRIPANRSSGGRLLHELFLPGRPGSRLNLSHIISNDVFRKPKRPHNPSHRSPRAHSSAHSLNGNRAHSASESLLPSYFQNYVKATV